MEKEYNDQKLNLKEWATILVVGLVFCTYYVIPYIWLEAMSVNIYVTSIWQLVVAYLLGKLAGITFFSKKHNDYKKAVSNIKKEMNQNPISNVKTYEQECELNTEIEKLIEEISTLEFQIQEDKIHQLIEEEVQQEKNKTTTPSIEDLKQMKKSITEEKMENKEKGIPFTKRMK